MLPWLQRYSRMLEDRVRLHWAMRLFLWIVNVPANKVREKQEQYRSIPEAGSVIVTDEGESWQAQAPSLHAADAGHDLEAVRGMVDAGSGYPPHWRGESGQANLATATAMQAPAERHLLRRQQYFSYILQDLALQAYQRAVQIGRVRPLPRSSPGRTGVGRELLQISVPDISRADNAVLASSARDLAQALSQVETLNLRSPTLTRQALRMIFKFAGEPLGEETIQEIAHELGNTHRNG
jgi:hypothetical protein